MSNRLDRYGEPVDERPVDERPHRCDDGWIDRDADNPRPCTRCKPHLAPAARRAQVGLPAAAQQPGDHRAGSAAVRAALARQRTA